MRRMHHLQESQTHQPTLSGCGFRFPVLIGRLGLLVTAILLMVNTLSAQAIPSDSLPPDSIRMGKAAIKDSLQPTHSESIIIKGSVVDKEKSSEDSAKVRKGFHVPELHLSPKKDFYDPKVALRRSLILPGWGQVYNNRLWKVPIIYGGFAVFISFVIGNQQGYKDYDRAVKCIGFPNSCVPNPYYQLGQTYGIDGIYSTREQYRRFRDLSLIICGLWYVLNLVDSYVDAHLRGFNVSDDLSLQVNPSLGLDPFSRKSMVVGGSISLNLRR